MKDANFFGIFVGIESPDPETLVQMKKKQNTRRNIPLRLFARFPAQINRETICKNREFSNGTGKFGSKNRRMKFSAHTGLGTGVRVSGIVSSADAGASYAYVLFLLCARRQSV